MQIKLHKNRIYCLFFSFRGILRDNQKLAAYRPHGYWPNAATLKLMLV